MMSLIVSAAPRSVKEAADIAASFQNEQAQKAGLHRAPRKAADMQLTHKVAKPDSKEAALYVFNNPNGGWVIVSADDNAASILGYSNKGTFKGTNPSVAYLLDYYAEQIALARPLTDEEKAQRAKAPRRAKAEETAVSPLLEIEGIRWNQGTPYNDLCPIDRYDGTHSATGCSATAAAQIMRYWKWPAQGRGMSSYTWKNKVDYDETNKHSLATYDTVLTINHEETTYDWANMLPQYHTDKYNKAQGHAVAVLMNHAGVAGHMGYGGDAAGGSGTFVNTMGSGLVCNFKYKFDGYYTIYENNGLTFDSIAKLYSIDLHAGRPIIMSGGGHAFVCDGMDGNGRFHINWGWGGYLDGFFVLSGLDPDNSSAVGSDANPIKYSKDLDFVHGLAPDTLPIHVTNIELDRTTRSLAIGETKKLQATITPADATCKGIYWTSSDEKIVSVTGYILMEEWERPDKDETKAWRSKITGVSAGTAIVSAITYDGELIASCEVTVTDDGGSTASDTTELVFNGVFEQSHEIGNKHVTIGLQGPNGGYYPYMYFQFMPDTLNWKIAGYYVLGSDNKVVGWLTEQMYNDGGYSESVAGWLNISCVAEGEYKFEGVYLADDNKYYKFDYTTAIDSIKEGNVKYALKDQAGDGTMTISDVTWYALGEQFATNKANNGLIVLPAGEPAPSTNGRVFVGWSASEVEATNIEPVMVKDGDEVNSNATYYAVYAERSTPSATPIEVASVKFNHYSGDDDKLSVANHIDSLMAYDKMGFKDISAANTVVGKEGIKMTASSKNGTLILTLDQPAAIKKVAVNAAQCNDDDECRIRVISESTMIGQVQAPGANLEYIANEPIESNTIKVAISNKRNAYIDKISVFAEDKGNYFNYSTSGEGTGTELPVVIVPINNEGLILTQDSMSLDITEKQQLVYTIAPYEYKDQSVTWVSSNPEIASVDENGVVTGISEGKATITITANNDGYSASCEVSVSNEVFANKLIFNGMFEHKYDSEESCFSIGLRGPEGGYYPYLWLRFHGDDTNWKIAGEYELNNQNYIKGWITEANYNGDKTDKSVSGWIRITCVEIGKYNFKGQYVSNDGLEYVFDYTTSISSVSDGNATHTLTDLPEGFTPEYVYFMSMGDIIDSTYILDGKLVMTTIQPADCDNMTFMGWTTEENYNSNVAPTYAKEGDVTTANTTYYAVYALLDENSSVSAEVASVVFKNMTNTDDYWYDDGYRDEAIENVMDSQKNISEVHAYYTRRGEHGIRIGCSKDDPYANHKGYIQLVMGKEETITKVVITSSKTIDDDLGNLYIDLGDVHDNNAISCGEDVEYTPTNPVKANSVKIATKEKAAYIKAVTIYAGQKAYKNYTTTTCYDPITTAISNGEKANGEWMKVIVNGQLYIIKNGVMYNVLGAMVK